MPVEFECPHCRAAMRTPDNAMGGKTGCPKCGGLLRVPTVEIPMESVAETHQFDKAAIAKRLAEGPAFDPDAAPQTAARRPNRRRKKRRGEGWWLLLGLLMLTAAAYGLYATVLAPGPAPTGTLAGTVADAPDLSRTLTLPDGPGSTATLALLDEQPVAVEGPTYRLEMNAAGEESRDVSVAYKPSEGSRVVRADLNAVEPGAAFIAANAERLRSQVNRAFAAESDAFASAAVDRGAAARYLERTAVLKHVDGLGAFVLGGAGSVGFPVVAEPEPGVLMFIVPASLKRLEILPSAGRGDVLPREFGFTVTLP